MKICHYVAPGFEIERNENSSTYEISFATPSSSIATQSIHLRLEDRQELTKTLAEGFEVASFLDGLIQVWKRGATLNFLVSDKEKTWETHVYLEEHLATALLRALAD